MDDTKIYIYINTVDDDNKTKEFFFINENICECEVVVSGLIKLIKMKKKT